jgi:hypothetical protein
MTTNQYTKPVSLLLTYGEAYNINDWSVYLELGLTEEHIPELIKMVGDKKLNQADANSKEVWAPLHAWRTLGMLQATEAIPALLDQLYQIDEYYDDWINDDMPQVFAMIGEPAIQGLTEYAGDTSRTPLARVAAGSSLSHIGMEHPETRTVCITGIEKALATYRQNDRSLNGSLISSLLDLKAKESFPVMQQAYQENCVDVQICGDLEEVEQELGLRKKRTTKTPDLYQLENILKKKQGKKIGRNEPCPCGSGKKYKKCCRNK